MQWRWCTYVVWLGLGLSPGVPTADVLAQDGDVATSLTQQRAQVRQQQAALRERLATLQQEIAAQDAQRRDVTQALKASESAISTLSHDLARLQQESQAVQADLLRLRDDITQQTAALDARRQALAEQLRVQYVHDLSPWAALLAGDDPQVTGRNLGYFGYVSQAQADAVRQVQQLLAQGESLQQQAQQRRLDLGTLVQTTQTHMHALQVQQQARQQQLQQLDAALRARRTQADQLLRDVRGLEDLVAKLEAEIARQLDVEKELLRASDGLNGLVNLQAKLPHPVQGQMHGRFGTERPEGGLWRGVVIRAAQGTPVRAVAPGRVVYAAWLTGFGNLMIVDHGAQYLTVYAYNQSLLRAVGDVVSAGQTIARVGATGGQVEPGLYFEIRHEGVPVNPRLWLQP